MPRIKKATDAQGTTFYPLSISEAVWDTSRNQRLSATVDDVVTLQEGMIYKNLYVGFGSQYSEAMTETCFHSTLPKGTALNFSPTSKKMWVIIPSTYTPSIMMEGFKVPMTLQANIDIEGEAYKVFGSDNTYTGSFDIFLF